MSTQHAKKPIYDGAEFVCEACFNSEGNNVAWEFAHPDEYAAEKAFPKSPWAQRAVTAAFREAFLLGWRARENRIEAPEQEYGVGWDWGEETIAFLSKSREEAEAFVARDRRPTGDDDTPYYAVRRAKATQPGEWVKL